MTVNIFKGDLPDDGSSGKRCGFACLRRDDKTKDEAITHPQPRLKTSFFMTNH